MELARLLFADFDVSVHGIVAQPFLLKSEVEQKVCKHEAAEQARRELEYAFRAGKATSRPQGPRIPT
ncbi:hypothetical protein ABZ400_26275 [Streptomyces sp. NPDC005897]|uniref:hypothetical protein n=1 Tax=Streptomyces sp. NPDC005897 TaxID=3157081 RepID=UPI0033CAAD86